jgi:hypothetical protein
VGETVQAATPGEHGQNDGDGAPWPSSGAHHGAAAGLVLGLRNSLPLYAAANSVGVSTSSAQRWLRADRELAALARRARDEYEAEAGEGWGLAFAPLPESFLAAAAGEPY